MFSLSYDDFGKLFFRAFTSEALLFFFCFFLRYLNLQFATNFTAAISQTELELRFVRGRQL